VIGQQALHHNRTARRLGRALDQVVGVLGRPDNAQAQLRRLYGPACITENTEHDLGHRLGALVRRAGSLGKGSRREHAHERHQ